MVRRDAEIQRLSAQLAQGPDVDALAQRYRNDANEAVILQLNQQARRVGFAACTVSRRGRWRWRGGRSGSFHTTATVPLPTPLFAPCPQVEALTAELTSVQERAVDRRTLGAAQQAQREAEARSNALAAEREGVAREVEAMQAALVRLQQEAAGEGAARRKLGALRSTLDRVRAEKALLEGQLTHAEAKVAELRDRLEQREVWQADWGGRLLCTSMPRTAQLTLSSKHGRCLCYVAATPMCAPLSFVHHRLQAALRKAQNRCKTLEGELSSSKAQQQQQQQQQPPTPREQQQPGRGAEQQDAASAELQAECMSLAGQLEEAQRLQHRAEALAAEHQQQCARLEQQVAQLQQAAAFPAEAARPVESVAVEQTAEEQAAEKGEAAASPAAATLASPAAATLAQQLAEKAAQLEQLEFERHELAVKLEESERRVAALTAQAAATKEQQQQPGADEASGKRPAGHRRDSDGSEQSWSLAAGETDASGSQVAADALAAARQEAGALKQQVQQLEGQVAALQAELAAVQAGAGGAAVADVAAAELRRQLQERTQEVADLSALSIKADATVQQYMAQLRRWVFCSSVGSLQ